MDLEGDIRRDILAHLPHEASDRAELTALPLRDLLVVYRNWSSRIVSSKPRKVHCSAALLSNPLARDPRYKPALDQIIAFTKAGTSIKPHLSREVKHGYRRSSRTKDKTRRKDLDLLLNDWCVYHLHLSTKIEGDGFVERHGPVLFATFSEDNAYLIDIFNHGDWTREHVIRVIVQEWPNAGLVCEIPESVGLDSSISEQDRKVIRQKHCNAFLAIDGKMYSPVRGGLSCSGYAIRHVLDADRLLRTVDWFKELVRNRKSLAAILAENGFALPSDAAFQFQFFENGGYGVVEKRTGIQIRLQ
jgi:hypothetical protein